MSEEKLYSVKNDEGEYWDFEDNLRFNRFELASRPLTSSNDLACRAAFKYHGHVVTFIQEPKKVVLSKEQAEIVDAAHNAKRPASYIILKSNDEELLMNAYVNGYTVAKEKKYNVKVPLVQAQGGLWFYINSDDKLDATYLQELAKKFTMEEIEKNGLQDCEKVECDNDDD